MEVLERMLTIILGHGLYKRLAYASFFRFSDMGGALNLRDVIENGCPDLPAGLICGTLRMVLLTHGIRGRLSIFKRRIRRRLSRSR